MVRHSCCIHSANRSRIRSQFIPNRGGNLLLGRLFNVFATPSQVKSIIVSISRNNVNVGMGYGYVLIRRDAVLLNEREAIELVGRFERI